MKLFSGLVFMSSGLGAIILVGSEVGYLHAFQIAFYAVLMSQGLRQIFESILQKKVKNKIELSK